jgi:hypothetical protein
MVALVGVGAWQQAENGEIGVLPVDMC